MTPSPRPVSGRGINPDWLKLPRRRCDNCGTPFKPARPESRFCKKACGQAFHHNGGSFAKLKPLIGKEVARQMALLEKCPDCKGTTRHRARRNEALGSCRCKDGKRLTAYGRQILAAIWKYQLPEESSAGLPLARPV